MAIWVDQGEHEMEGEVEKEQDEEYREVDGAKK